MAVVDPEDHAIVLSVVYDGPPRAGKTSSVYALARGFGREVCTPEARDGRTVFFDWVEHTGGRFDGNPLRCEIASVPGQRRWVRRRALFLDRADVIVFVGDTRARAWATTLDRLHDLVRRLALRPGTPVGVVFQANHRDHPTALPLDELRTALAAARVAIVESTAHDGGGVREAFVFAIRLALDRVRAEQAAGRLATGRTVLGDRDEVLGVLRGLAVEPAPPEEEPVDAAVDATPTPTPVATPPAPPSVDVPVGCVWPPVDGRIVLGALPPHRQTVTAAPDGWQLQLPGGWRVHSWRDARYRDLDRARGALIAWAGTHARAGDVLSARRCVLVAADGASGWRLWQVVADEPTLRERTDAGDLTPAAATALLAAARHHCARHDLALACALDNVGVDDAGRPRFVGLVPAPVGGAR
ncbi:MAG: GTPase domain-containing protein [Myxococcales bacterium]|nr:GTPase domain-containing protein [Myxococcales bacterium]